MFVVCGQVTDHATTALLHYQLPQMPDVVVRSFMVSSSWSFFLITLHPSVPLMQAFLAFDTSYR